MSASERLNLTTEAEPTHVTIDGEPYPLRRPGALTLSERVRFDGLLKTVIECEAEPEGKDAEYEAAISDACRLALVGDPPIDKLDLGSKVAIFRVFFLAGAPSNEAAKSNSRRGSNGSTAASRRTGSRSRQKTRKATSA